MTTDTTTALLVTADMPLRTEVVTVANRQRVPLTTADVIPSPGDYLAAPLVLLGADQVESAVRATLPIRPMLIIVALDPADAAIFEHAGQLTASYVAFLPTAASWLAELLDNMLATRTGPAGPDGANRPTLAHP